MQQILESSAHIMYFGMAIVFCFYIGFSNRKQSTFITMIVVIAFHLVMTLAEPRLMSISDKNLLRFMWYNTFAICDIGLMLMLFHLHRKAKIPYGISAKHTNFSFMCMAFLQVFCFLERTYTSSEIVKTTYSYTIPAINISIMLLLTGIMLKEIFVLNTNSISTTEHTN